MNQKQTPNYTFALIIVIAVCFLIGFVTTMNNSMIEFCKEAFKLSDAQGQLVNTAFYGAYALSIPFGFMMSKIGYKKTLILGLAVVFDKVVAAAAGVAGHRGVFKANHAVQHLVGSAVAAAGIEAQAFLWLGLTALTHEARGVTATCRGI